MPPLSRTVASGPMAAVLLGLKHLVVTGMRGRRRVKFRPVLCPPQVGFADPPRVLLSRLCSGASFVQYSFNRRVFQPSRHQGSIPLLSLGLGPHIRTLRPALLYALLSVLWHFGPPPPSQCSIRYFGDAFPGETLVASRQRRD